MKIELCDLTITQDLAIIRLYKPRKRKVEQTVLDDERNKGKDPKKDIMALKKVTENVLLNFQSVEILAISPDNRSGITVGDIVVIDWRKARECDLVKDAFIINTYEIIGKLNLV
jgi:hypothetical protein